MDVLRERGYVAQVKDSKNCLIFDKQIYQSGAATGSSTPQMKKFCGPVSVAPIDTSFHINADFICSLHGIFNRTVNHCSIQMKWQNQISCTFIPPQMTITGFLM